MINPSITANSDRPDTYDQLPTGGYPGKNRMFEIFQFYSITMGYKNKARLSRNSSKMVLDVLKCAKNVWESALRFILLFNWESFDGLTVFFQFYWNSMDIELNWRFMMSSDGFGGKQMFGNTNSDHAIRISQVGPLEHS